MDRKLADLLLDPEAAPAKVQAHVAECVNCRRELDELRATMDLMDTWKGPEPSPYFVTRLHARFREELEAEPAGTVARWIARMKAGILYGERAHARPLAAMALTIMLLVGGGTYLNLTDMEQPQAVTQQTAVVNDLETMDNNAQLLDTLENISDAGDNGE